MPDRRTYTLFTAISIALGTILAVWFVPRPSVEVLPLPAQYSDSEFWQMVNDFSEPGGFFRSDNFVSNETTFQAVIPELRRKTKPAGVYIGVGPDQNFTYILALQPKLAFIVDIRRQNLLQHLLFKSLIEMSDNRAQFLSRLFARPVPVDLPDDPTVQQLFDAFAGTVPREDLFRTNLRQVMDLLTDTHHFSLEEDDPKTIEYVYQAFFDAGPEIRYSYPSQYGWRRFPTYAELMMETDGTGENHAYLASEENFRSLKVMEQQNRIVPVVGDFAGDKALRRLGDYLHSHGTTVTAFYTSNVEYYLFQNEDWRKFFNNVLSLPVDGQSTFIRAYFSNQRFPPQGGLIPLSLLDSIPACLASYNQGAIHSYEDVIRRSR
jgi:hypothetical protein